MCAKFDEPDDDNAWDELETEEEEWEDDEDEDEDE